MILNTQNGKKVYSDGSETELRMLDIAEKYPEEQSREFISGCNEYTINNTFSAVRNNILNWYPFKKDAEVCEIGAGMGAITGMLCDKCKSITSIEMNNLRADVIRSRYPERENLTVLSEDIRFWKTDKRFDYIVFVGVLEYAAVFSKEKNPFEGFLKDAARLLKEDGVLLFAIENRFGLKYWCGASEDHLQKPFVGLEGYKQPRTPRTFSKKELEDMLLHCGLGSNRFYYVLPDYKFPNIICTDEYMPSYNELMKVPFTYGKNSILLFDEKERYKDVLENKRLDFFANSFLVEASFRKLDDNHVVYVSARGECKPEYKIVTTIDKENVVRKTIADAQAIAHIEQIYENTEYLKQCDIKVLDYERDGDALKCKIFKGKKADEYFEEALKNNDFSSICKIIDKLKEALIKSSEYSSDADSVFTQFSLDKEDFHIGPILKKGFIDMTFYNAFVVDEDLVFYDQEWCFENIPLNFILYYAIKCIYKRAQIDSNLRLDNLLGYVGIGDETVVYDKLEEKLWSTVLYRQGDVYGADGYCNLYQEEHTLKYILDEKENLVQKCVQKEEELAEKEEEIARKKVEIKDREEKIKEKEEEIKEKIKEKDAEIEEKIREKEEEIKKEIRQKQEEIKERCEEIKEKEAQLKEDLIQIKNKEGHIEQLLEVEREFENLKHSRAWKVMTFIWSGTGKVIPNGSKRRLVVKVGWKLAKSPGVFIRKLTPARIRKFFYYLKREGVSGVSRRLDESIRGTKVVPQEVVINEVSIIEKAFEEYEKLDVPRFSVPKVSIIIPVYNQFDFTYNCIKSIIDNSGEVSLEIIIANDCSNDLTVRIEEIISGLNVVTNDNNLRFLKNCNHAAKFAKGQYVLFLNNDTQVQDNWLEPLEELIERDEKVGMVGSKLIYPDGRLQEAGGILWKDASAWNYGHLSDPTDPEYNYVKEVDYISGASIMIKKSLWEKVGGFDERFVPAYFEDADLAFEVRKHGYKVMYQPLSVVVHFEGRSNGTDTSSGQKSYQIINQKKFYEKWKEVLEKEHFANAENVFLARDRSRFKKQILVVDHYVPHHDKDAGGKCTFMYMKLFLSLGMKVTFIGDNYFKHEPYTTELNQMGVEVLYGNYYFNNWKRWLEENGNYFDYAYLNRPHISEKYINLVKKHSNCKLIYFGHDLHYLREYRQYEIEKDTSLLKSSNQWKEREFALFHKADIIYVVGSYEQSILEKEFPEKPVRNIPVYIYDGLKENVNTDFRMRKDIIFVGGFGHPPNIDAVLWFKENVFPKILEKHPGIKWYIVGSKPTDEILSLADENIIVTGFVDDDELERLYATCRMAVVPLRVGAGVKGKVVEAVYNRIPLITTPIGAEGLSLEEKAFVVTECNEKMVDAINELYEDFDELLALSENCKEFISNYFTTKTAKEVVSKDIDYNQKERKDMLIK